MIASSWRYDPHVKTFVQEIEHRDDRFAELDRLIARQQEEGVKRGPKNTPWSRYRSEVEEAGTKRCAEALLRQGNKLSAVASTLGISVHRAWRIKHDMMFRGDRVNS